MPQKTTPPTTAPGVLPAPKKAPHVRDYPSIAESLRQFDFLPDSAHVRQPTVEALFGISAATVWRRVGSGTLPRPHKFSERVTTWKVGELRAMLNTKAAA